MTAVAQYCQRRGKVVVRTLFAAVVLGAITTEAVAFHRESVSAIRAVSRPNPVWLLIAVAAEMASMSAAAHLHRRMLMTGGIRASMRAMAPLTYAANAVSVTLPAGNAISTGYTYRRLRTLGASGPLATFTLLAGGALSTLAFGLISLIALAASGTARTGSILLAAGTLTFIALALCSRSRLHRSGALTDAADRVLKMTNRLLRRAPDTDTARLLRVIEDLRQVSPRGRDWAAGLGFAVVNWTADLACFLAAGKAIGADDATLSLVVIAYIAGMSVAGISLLPGGIGLVDAAMILVLHHGGLSPITATAAVLLYRAVSYAFIALLGWTAWTVNWNQNRHFTIAHPSEGNDHAAIR